MDPRGQSYDEAFAQEVGEQWLTDRIAHGLGSRKELQRGIGPEISTRHQ